MFKKLTKSEIIRSILIDFIPAFFGVLCAFGLSNLSSNIKERKFVDKSMNSIYRDTKENISIHGRIIDKCYNFIDTLNNNIDNPNVSLGELSYIANFDELFITISSGWETLKLSDSKSKLDYETLSFLTSLEKIGSTVKNTEDKVWNIIHNYGSSTSKFDKSNLASTLNLYVGILEVLKTWELTLFTNMRSEYEVTPILADRDKKYNLALNKPVKASSVESNEFKASFVNDGSSKTRWASTFVDSAWIQINLEKETHIQRIILDWEMASALEYKIQVSNDTLNWNTIINENNSFGGLEEHIIDKKAIYLRLYCTKRITTYGNSLYEIEIY